MMKKLLKRIQKLDHEKFGELLEKLTTLELNHLDEAGNTILHLAVKTFLEKERTLSKMGAETKEKTDYNQNSTSIIKKLVSKMSDWAINSVDGDGFTAMHYSFQSDNHDMSWAISGLNSIYFKTEQSVLGGLEELDQ